MKQPDVSAWPERPRLAVKEMMAKYGAPLEVSSEAIIWHNAGPFKRIMVTKKEIPHDFCGTAYGFFGKYNFLQCTY